ncbi:hypothetical protein BJ165DRAFT_1496354 [Panaeolus papilionaceus]|nr:hypothetical protein BJ165DRAFT_1496354 [Panaeolus papilionaceus]
MTLTYSSLSKDKLHDYHATRYDPNPRQAQLSNHHAHRYPQHRSFSAILPSNRHQPSQSDRVQRETRKRNERKRCKERRDAEEQRRVERLEEERRLAEEQEIQRRVVEKIKAMQRVIWGTDTPVHTHELEYNQHHLDGVLALEHATGKPLDPKDPNFCAIGTKWISEEGIHLGMCNNEVIFVARITPVATMSAASRAECENAINIIMGWTTCVNIVKNNASQVCDFLIFLRT